MSYFNLFSKGKQSGDTITFVECLSYPMTKIVDHFKDFLILTGIVSFIISQVTFLCGRSFFCGFQVGTFCSDAGYKFIFTCLVNLYGVAFFVNRWQMISQDGEAAFSAMKKNCFAKDLKAIGLILFYLVLWGIVGGCALALKLRVATESFAFELGYFVLFSSLIIFVMLLLLNFVGFYRYLQGGAFFTFHKTVGKLCDSIYAIMFSFFIYMFIFIFFIFRGEEEIRSYIQYGVFWEYIGEFYLYFMFCSVLAVYVSTFNYQIKKLFADK